MTRSATPPPENGPPELPETVHACHDMILELLRSQNQLMDRLSVGFQALEHRAAASLRGGDELAAARSSEEAMSYSASRA